MSDTPERYHIYDAEAEALSGNLTLPLIQEVKPPTFVKLNERGGYVSQHAENFRLGGAVSFRSAYTQVGGNPSTKSDHGWNTLTTSVIEGLNVLDIVTADRIVAQISTDHPPVGYVPTVTFLGTRYENLRIAGHAVKVSLDLNMLGDKPKNDASYTSDRDFIKRIAAQRDHIQSQKDIPTGISTRYNRLPSISDKQGKIECSLVNQTGGRLSGAVLRKRDRRAALWHNLPRDPDSGAGGLRHQDWRSQEDDHHAEHDRNGDGLRGWRNTAGRRRQDERRNPALAPTIPMSADRE